LYISEMKVISTPGNTKIINTITIYSLKFDMGHVQTLYIKDLYL